MQIWLLHNTVYDMHTHTHSPYCSYICSEIWAPGFLLSESDCKGCTHTADVQWSCFWGLVSSGSGSTIPDRSLSTTYHPDGCKTIPAIIVFKERWWYPLHFRCDTECWEGSCDLNKTYNENVTYNEDCLPVKTIDRIDFSRAFRALGSD